MTTVRKSAIVPHACEAMFDLVDGGSPVPTARTPEDLPVGRYSYFCRIHPWMRGAFEVVK